jgi:hypothetical protein
MHREVVNFAAATRCVLRVIASLCLTVRAGQTLSLRRPSTATSSYGKSRRLESSLSSTSARISSQLLVCPPARMARSSRASQTMEQRRCSMCSISVRPASSIQKFCVLMAYEDMINMLKLGYKPLACCWVHKRGQAQGLLAVCVQTFFANSNPLITRSSEVGTGTIRLYDGRGNATPLETNNLHRFPVHVMTVCAWPKGTPCSRS